MVYGWIRGLCVAYFLHILGISPAFAQARFEPLPLEVVWSTRTEDPNGRKMKIKTDFSFVDAAGTRWLAPAGSVVDGASIPQVFWSVVGGPYEGLYRDASVVHDVACVQRNRRWQAVHRMFYEAMLASGVDPIKAKIMYGAVYYFGPRWTTRGGLDRFTSLWGKRTTSEVELAVRGDLAGRIGPSNVPSFGMVRPLAEDPSQREQFKGELRFFERLSAEIKTNDLTLDQIESFK